MGVLLFLFDMRKKTQSNIEYHCLAKGAENMKTLWALIVLHIGAEVPNYKPQPMFMANYDRTITLLNQPYINCL